MKSFKINEMSINDNSQISKNALDYKMISVNKSDCISRNHRNNENDIESNAEHRIYKKFYNKLINLKQIFKNDIIIFDKHKTSVDFHKNKL